MHSRFVFSPGGRLMNPKQLLHFYDITPRRQLGQNFLSDPGILAHIVELAGVEPGDVVLEIGPGTGTLTRQLAKVAGRVVAVEIDARLVPVLRQETDDLPNVEVVNADILEVDVGALMGEAPFQVVANLPYYATSAILRHLLERPRRPTRITVTVQREVAQRLTAEPDDMSLLTVSVQFYGQPRVVQQIKAGAFWPMPAVDSSVVRIDIYQDGPSIPIAPQNERHFFRVVRAGFGQKRKQLKNALAAGLALKAPMITEAFQQAGVAPSRRAETLSMDEWAALTNALMPHL
jgi:16S rRNA (adenine1518-N6/adenine1519-N6)-dimethyltransferase